MKRLYEYMMLDPLPADELPAGQVEYEIFKEEDWHFCGWGIIYGCGFVVYDRPLTGDEVDHYNLDGPVLGWG